MSRVRSRVPIAAVLTLVASILAPSAARAAEGRSDPSACPKGGQHFDFDELADGAVVTDAYARFGVTFRDDRTVPLVTSSRRGQATSSEPRSVLNHTEQGVKPSPLSLAFEPPRAFVGMFTGNGPTGAVLTAFDSGGKKLGDHRFTLTKADVALFAGIEDAGKRIARVELEYIDESLPEQIDDLCSDALPDPGPPPKPRPITTKPPRAPLPAPDPAISIANVTILKPSPKLSFGLDLSLRGFEVTQSVQCFDSTAGLAGCPDNSAGVAIGKGTLVRAHGRVTGFASHLSNVKYRLTALAFGKTYTFDFTGPARSTLSRASLLDTANAYLKAFNGTDATVQFAVVIDPDNAIAETDETNNRFPAAGYISKVFTKTKSFKVAGVRLDYHPSGFSGTRVAAGTDVTGAAAAWWEAAMPVADGAITYALRSGTLDWTTTLNGDGQHALIQTLNMLWFAENLLGGIFATSPAILGARHVYGWIPNSAGNFGHADMPVYPHAGGFGIVGIGTDGDGGTLDAPTPGGLIFGHELTHDYNVLHTDVSGDCGADDDASDWPYTTAGIQEFGVNPNTGAVYSPSDTHDLMSYCPAGGSQRGWIAPFHWNKMLGRLDIDSGWSSTSAPQPLLVQPVHLMLSGAAGRLGVGLSAPSTMSPTAGDPASDFAIEQRGATGALIRRDPFPVSFRDEYGNARLTADAVVAVPLASATAQIRLMNGGAVLDSRARSQSPPQVSVVGSTPATWEPGTTQSIRWTTADLDGDELRSTVLYSNDDGKSWATLATDLPGTIYRAPVDTLAGGTARFNIVVSDGFHIASAMTAPISIPRKPPVASIAAPSDGSLHPEGGVVAFRGSGSDLEDGAIEPGSFEWSSDRDGVLGYGPALETTELSPGAHEITLSVLDSDGYEGTDTVEVVVVQVKEPTVTPAPSSTGREVSVAAAVLARDAQDLTCTIDFGDGTDPVTTQPANGRCSHAGHAYAAPGAYPVTVTVLQGAREVGSAWVLHDVLDKPQVSFLAPRGGLNAQVGSVPVDGAPILVLGATDVVVRAGGPAAGPLTFDLLIDGVAVPRSQISQTGEEYRYRYTPQPGSHTITARASNLAGETTEASIGVTGL